MLSPYKFAITLCFLTLTICDPVPNEPSEDPIRHTSKGNVKGTEITTRQGNSAWIFYGVPYASRPQRFLKPRPLTKWSGTKDCKVAKPDCIGDYTGPLKLEKRQSEDCLYMDIIQPKTCDSHKLCPVFIYIKTDLTSDPGAFVNNMASRDIMVVTVAYRKGIFGFLNMDDGLSQDYDQNVGLHDLIKSINFISQEISHFGGDKNKVTLGGHKIGASLVGYLAVSSVARSLSVNNLAFISGAAGMVQNPTEKSNVESSNRLAKENDCPYKNKAKMLACLRKLSSDQLRTKDYFGPCLDGVLFNQNLHLLRQRRRKFPTLIGISEGLTAINDSIKNMCKNGANKLGYQAQVVIDQCRNYYVDKNSSMVYFDTTYVIPTFMEASSLAAKSKQTFLYEIDAYNATTFNSTAGYFVQLFTNFIKTGTPSDDWKPLTYPGFNYFLVKDEQTSKNKALYHFETLEFWLLTAPNLQSGYFFAKEYGTGFDYQTGFWFMSCTAVILALILLTEIAIKLCNKNRKNIYRRYTALNSSSGSHREDSTNIISNEGQDNLAINS